MWNCLGIKKVQQEYINRNLKGTYGMDAFIEDEIRVSKKKTYMVFLFGGKNRECYLNQGCHEFPCKVEITMAEYLNFYWV